MEKLEKEYDLEVEWSGLEIHPETPTTGVKLSERFSKSNLDHMLNSLNHSGSPYGIHFGPLERMPNSHNALEAAEFARAHGRLKEYHSALMDAYFIQSKDIGDLEVLTDLGKTLGLNKEELTSAVKTRAYETILNNSAKDAHSLKINSTPTFVINNKYSIVGAQPIEEFRKLLDTLK